MVTNTTELGLVIKNIWESYCLATWIMLHVFPFFFMSVIVHVAEIRNWWNRWLPVSEKAFKYVDSIVLLLL